MDNVRWLDEREMSAWRGYVNMRRDLDNAVHQQLLQAGLSSPDYELLAPLSEAPGRRLRAIELRRVVGWEKSRLSHQIRRMEQRGLLQRVECPSDGRSTYVVLTDAGLTAIEAAAPGHLETVRRHFVDLMTEEELEIFSSIARRVMDSVLGCPFSKEEENGGAPAPAAPAELGDPAECIEALGLVPPVTPVTSPVVPVSPTPTTVDAARAADGTIAAEVDDDPCPSPA